MDNNISFCFQTSKNRFWKSKLSFYFTIRQLFEFTKADLNIFAAIFLGSIGTGGCRQLTINPMDNKSKVVQISLMKEIDTASCFFPRRINWHPNLFFVIPIFWPGMEDISDYTQR